MTSIAFKPTFNIDFFFFFFIQSILIVLLHCCKLLNKFKFIISINLVFEIIQISEMAECIRWIMKNEILNKHCNAREERNMFAMDWNKSVMVEPSINLMSRFYSEVLFLNKRLKLICGATHVKWK